jgi:hypothetical protein
MATLSAEERELLEIRKTIIVAIASDDALMERLILKGGNALDIIYKLGERSSLDVDFSMGKDFQDLEELEDVKVRLFHALRDRFDSSGYVLFDEQLEERPRNQGGPGLTVWGGYNAKFKLIPKGDFSALGGILGVPPTREVLDKIRRQAQVSGPGFQRVFLIEISKFEYIEGRILVNVEDYDCYVYTPAMIAAEKFRAICQQLPDYEKRRNPAPRPRDFYDIHTIATCAGCDLSLPEHHALIQNMFAAKEVPLALLSQIGTESVREFHEQHWPSVVDAVRGGVAEPFDYYFNFVVQEAQRLVEAMDLPGSGQDKPAG